MKHLYTFLLVLCSFLVNAQANDECANAEVITINVTTATTINYDTTTATESVDASCDTYHVYHDLWYEFTMPIDGNIRITNADIFDFITVYDSCGGAEVACISNNGYIYGLTGSVDYKLRIANRDSFADNKSLDIIAVEVATNDECNAAEAITVTTTSATTINYNTITATESLDASCDSNHVFHDLWYEFTMPINGSVRITNADIFDFVTLYDSCGGTEITCISNNGYLYNLTASTNYKLRIANRVSFTDNKSLDIIATEIASNDECNAPEAITVTTETELTINYNTITATESLDASCDSNHIFHDLWYEFTMPVNGNVNITDADIFDFFTLYDACSGTELFCDSNSTVIPSLTSGTNYILRIANRINFTEAKSVNIIALPIAVNDTCESGIALAATETSQTIDFEIAGAQINNESGCSGVSDFGDIWYDVSPAIDGNLNINGNINWNQFELFDSCSGTSLGCFSGSGTFSDLVTTNTYKLRVFREENLLDNEFLSFSFQMQSTLGVTNFKDEDFKLYPNPVKDKLTIQSQSHIEKLELYNILGKKIATHKNTNTLSLKTFKSGVYLLKITTEKGEAIKRLIVE